MKKPDIPDNEELRLRILQQLNILDTVEEQAYDDLTFLAAQICGTPIALVTLVDKDRQWFKSHYGLDVQETPREVSFCGHAILGDELFLVEESAKDERFADNPLVTGTPDVKFYAGEPLIIEDGIHLGTLCVIDDHARSLSDEQKSALKALARQVTSQLQLRLRLFELKQLDEAKDEFISMVSHELRTPLTSIKGSLGLLNNNLRKEQVSPQTHQMAAIALRNTDGLLNIVNDILDVAKLEAGKLVLESNELNVMHLLQQAQELNEAYAANNSCSLKVKVSPAIVNARFVGDEQRLLQVLANLISNATKFTYDGDVIVLKAEVEDGGVLISVIDHGGGISKADQKLIFRRFEQLGVRGNTRMPGTGLGLNICKHIVELHQGEIGFEVVANEYTRFHFSLPLQV
ncbi:MAG: GAF domain-containing sensor histidine kinase [Gammaproteobacteria bacterium]|nr:GAF domain-containing sensor histidine kinase [Gammaproteobacteria bacterium]